jgi:hypothetical protein
MRRFLFLIIQSGLGIILGLLLLEPVFRSNTTLLPRGIAAPLPVDPPLADRTYTVRYADADIFYWQASIVRPPEKDLLEAVVHWRTDEFGFPNPAASPATADLVVLGRSYAMGAQATEPWPSVLRDRYGYRVLNLSQTGAGLRQKRDFLERFGLPRSPRFAVIEVLPPFDILGYGPAAEPFVVQRAFLPFTQTVLRRLVPVNAGAGSEAYIYPLQLEWEDGGCECVFYSGYLSPLSLSADSWSESVDWLGFRADLSALVEILRSADVVPILLFVPTKENIYLALADDPESASEALAAAGSYVLSEGRLVRRAAAADPRAVRANALAAAELLREFAGKQSLCLVDPTAAFELAARNGTDPFMRYDTHWSAWGHALVARETADAMESGACR